MMIVCSISTIVIMAGMIVMIMAAYCTIILRFIMVMMRNNLMA
ncbi:MAG: hypothetical protein ACNS62_11230 [Candidatus Cyclobacteriaceae bacterium M3_2C_046]